MSNEKGDVVARDGPPSSLLARDGLSAEPPSPPPPPHPVYAALRDNPPPRLPPILASLRH